MPKPDTGSRYLTFKAGRDIIKGDLLRQPKKSVVPWGNVKSTKRFVGIACEGAKKGESVTVFAQGTRPVELKRDDLLDIFWYSLNANSYGDGYAEA